MKREKASVSGDPDFFFKNFHIDLSSSFPRGMKNSRFLENAMTRDLTSTNQQQGIQIICVFGKLKKKVTFWNLK